MRPPLPLACCLAGVLALIASSTSHATTIVQHYDFATPTISWTDTDHHRVVLDGTWSYGAPGQPVLPMAPARILLPPGETITSIEVVPGEWVPIAGTYLVEVGQPQHPLSDAGPHRRVPADPALYGSAQPFPGRLHDAPTVGLFRGHRIAQLALHPVEYVPATGTLRHLESLELRITTAPSGEALAECARMLRRDAATTARVARMVDNAAALADYEVVAPLGGGRLLDPEARYSYVIVTTTAWADGLDELVDFETQRGHKTGVFTIDWILANYPGGVDTQDSIRDFVIDAYQTWGIQYLLLVGDARDSNGVPHRGLYSTTDYGTSDSDIPADMYYGCLDGTWNDDGDGYWGEPGEDDLYHEVAVGRACIDTQAELENFVTKVTRYRTQPIVQECGEALMVGELLWSDPTWGGDYKDEILFGASTHGYTTAGFPLSMNVGVLYDRNSTWSKTQLITLMESGLNIVNHLGHCDVDYAMKMYLSDIPSFDNDGTVHSYNFVYSQGCYCGSFDNRTSGGSYTSDCFAETFQTDDDGAVAVIMNARYGWGQHESTNGSSQYFDREFFDAMFGEAIWPVGLANDDSKMDTIWAINYGANRYCYYELNVFGDPAMHLWTGEPGTLVVDAPSSVFIGQPVMEVSVSDGGGGPVAGATVTAYTEDLAVYTVGMTDATGIAVLHPEAQYPGTLSVRATAHDFLDGTDELAIVPPSGPYLVLDGCTVLDAGGDGDGVLDAGETVDLEVTLENVGIEPTTGVTATVSTDDPHVDVTGPMQAFPDIAAGTTGTCLAPFVLQVLGTVPDGHVVAFTIDIASNEGQWDGHFNLGAEAPVLEARDMTVDDAAGGNADGGADPGEVIALVVELANVGHSACGEVSALLSCAHPDVTVLGAAGSCPGAAIGGEGVVGVFQLEIGASCPDPAMIPFQVELTGAMGFATTLDYELAVGPWFDDGEADRGWTLGAPDDDASTGHWVREEPVGTVYNGSQCQPELDHTADPAEICFVTGNADPGAAAGTNDVDNGKTTLLTPVFDLADAVSATVSYWRWYTNDLGNNPGEDWWSVDVTADGVSWTHLEYTQTSANVWTEQTFDLGAHVPFTDHCQLRFVADDQSPGALVEAAIDDFALDVVRSVSAGLSPVDVDAVRAANGFVSISPNPFNPATRITYRVGSEMPVELGVYDVQGRMVRKLVDGTVEAGTHTVAFDGRSTAGRMLGSGIYFLRLETPAVLEVRQVTLVK